MTKNGQKINWFEENTPRNLKYPTAKKKKLSIMWIFINILALIWNPPYVLSFVKNFFAIFFYFFIPLRKIVRFIAWNAVHSFSIK